MLWASEARVPIADVSFASMSSLPHRTLLEPGHEAEWARINEEEEHREAEFAATLSIPERLEFGQKLCDQAFTFFNVVRASGHGPQRDPRT
jgi:hypothetical protein